MLIADEVQCGYGRTGSFFAHQWSGIKPDLITVAKGMANGFPMGGVLISPNIKHIEGFLGSSFGGNHLGCAAALAVLDVFETENVVENAADAGDYLLARLRDNPYIKDVRGRGLMIGIELRYPVEGVRKTLLYDHNIFTGVSGDNTIRLTPPLCIKKRQISDFVKVFSKVLLNININNLQ
jgi:acetylornithine aminotransferase